MIAVRLVLILGLISLQACVAELARNPVPGALAGSAQVASMPQVRFWGDALPENYDQIVAEIVEQLKTRRPELRKRRSNATTEYLAISGGGSDGAFGAGLLVGWSDAGTRPQFEIVTGISTGALAAPFAYLGSGYDRQLRQMYTAYTTSQIARPQFLAGILGGSSLGDNSRLADMIARYVDANMLRQIAIEHAKGRRLLIGTTDLDAQRPVVWNMGAIASSGHPDALPLFRKILLASAAIPGLFPPVFIDVVAGGKRWKEMHVDGGVTGQVFFLPSQIMFAPLDKKYGLYSKRNLYIIRNGKLSPEYKAVQARTLPIASRSISTIIKNQGISDLYKIYNQTRTNKIGYNLAAIPADFSQTSTEPFDPVYMSALFDAAYLAARTGYDWSKAPPGRNDGG